MLAGCIETGDQRLVEEVIPHPSVECLADPVLLAFAVGGEMPRDPGGLRPAQMRQRISIITTIVMPATAARGAAIVLGISCSVWGDVWREASVKILNQRHFDDLNSKFWWTQRERNRTASLKSSKNGNTISHLMI